MVRVELSAFFHNETPELDGFVAELPPWTAASYFTGFQRVWTIGLVNDNKP